LDRRIPESCTETVPLLGAAGYDAWWNRRHTLARASGLPEPRIEHLLGRYGSLVEEVLELVAGDSSLGDAIASADDYLRAEVVYAVSHEGARHIDDVLTRRTRVSIEEFDRGTGAAREVADLMAGVLGWDEAQRDREVEHYLKRVEAERESQQMPDDETADAARMGGADVVPISTA
ncbi:MAG TPA: glycerol-3-phosphate dehydrogenase C-terminal domain-containing protein, partial [Nocardioidaceae bacterium]|nr:glycerol-3-phosphate dehydrogenase C-terminal domain-containing protein [Nocardioidaceae bacterium]